MQTNDESSLQGRLLFLRDLRACYATIILPPRLGDSVVQFLSLSQGGLSRAIGIWRCLLQGRGRRNRMAIVGRRVLQNPIAPITAPREPRSTQNSKLITQNPLPSAVRRLSLATRALPNSKLKTHNSKPSSVFRLPSVVYRLSSVVSRLTSSRGCSLQNTRHQTPNTVFSVPAARTSGTMPLEERCS